MYYWKDWRSKEKWKEEQEEEGVNTAHENPNKIHVRPPCSLGQRILRCIFREILMVYF